MDEAKILELARKVEPLGIHPVPEGSSEHGITRAELVAFARLVAAAERERLYHEALKRGIDALENRGRLIDGIMEGGK